MILRIIIIMCLSSILSCQSTDKLNGDKSFEYGVTEFHFEENLKGPIKKIELKSYITDNDFIEEKPGHQYSWGSNFIREFEFNGTQIVDQKIDGKGELMDKRIQLFRPDGIRLMDSSASKYILYKYNEDDFLSYEGNPYSHEIHNYDGQYLISKIYIEDKDTLGISRIVSKGDTIYEFAISENDTVGLEISVENEFQLPTYFATYDEDGLIEITKTKYDNEKLKPIVEIWNNYDSGEISGAIITEFENGDEVKITEFNENEVVDYVETIAYKYDDYGNWIEKRINHGDEKYYLEVRLISYY